MPTLPARARRRCLRNNCPLLPSIVDIMKSALERIAGIEMFHSLDVSMWNNLPLFKTKNVPSPKQMRVVVCRFRKRPPK